MRKLHALSKHFLSLKLYIILYFVVESPERPFPCRVLVRYFTRINFLVRVRVSNRVRVKVRIRVRLGLAMLLVSARS